MKLPNRKEYPEYYSVIKKPIDINKIMNYIDDGKVPLPTFFFFINYYSNYLFLLAVFRL